MIENQHKSLPEVGFANSLAGIGVAVGGALGIAAAMTGASIAGVTAHARDWAECALAGGFLGCSLGAIIGAIADHSAVRQSKVRRGP